MKAGFSVRDISIVSRDGHTIGMAWWVARSNDHGRSGRAYVDYLKAGKAIRDIGIVSRDGDTGGVARCIGRSHDHGRTGRAYVNYQKAGSAIRYIGIVSRDCHAPGFVRRITGSSNVYIILIVDATAADSIWTDGTRFV
jgi:hypothetical protein